MVTHDIVAAVIDDQFSTDVAQIDRTIACGAEVQYVSRSRAKRMAMETGSDIWARYSDGPTLFLMQGGARYRVKY